MRDRTLAAFGFLGVVALLVSTAALAVILTRPAAQAPSAARDPNPAAPRSTLDAGPSLAPESAWRPAPAVLAKAVDVAFWAGASLSTDGKLATFDSGDGSTRPVEVPAAIPRVFSASGRLFAVGENEGAPFAIVLAPGEEPLVVPMPCSVTRLAGENGILAGLCADGSGLALSADAGKSFRPVAVDLPVPAGAQDVEVERRLEAVAVSPAGAILLASAQRWQSATPGGVLAWTWGQVTLRPAGSRALRTSNVQALAHTVGLHLSGGSATLAGLQVALGGAAEGEVRPRLYRGAEGEPPVAVGTAGPPCGTVAAAKGVQGVLLGTEVAAFACGDRLVSTMDGGATWSADALLGKVDVLRGGDMRLFAKAGDKAWERRFVDRSETGATAVRVPGAVLVRRDGGLAQGPMSAAFGILEPVDAGGAAADAGDADAATP
ncbi:MAG TPA: hypothetical protein VGK67_11400 [Myxococcales bacterium]|jgi:hypothetical protein